MKGTIGIIGAGISGLSAGIFFRNRGVPFEILEKYPGITAAGAGIIVPANAMKLYSYLHLDRGIDERGAELNSMNVRDERGGIISRIDMRDVIRFTGKRSVAIERSILHRFLYDNLYPEDISFKKNLVSVQQSERGVRAGFEDGTFREFVALIGADGIHSSVLKNFPANPLRNTGEYCYRGLADVPGVAIESDYSGNEFWSRRGRFGFVPVGPDRVYWYATIPDSDTVTEPPEIRRLLLKRFSKFHRIVEASIDSTDESQILHGRLYDREPMRKWTSGRVTLLGDAAHPTTPNLGQGAAMGIESAYVLAECLNRFRDPEASFNEYERLRKSRTRTITRMSWQLGRLANLRNGPAIRIRNLLMKITPSFINTVSLQRIFGVPNIM